MTQTLTKPEAILFDWDNTLVDSWPTIHQALTETFEVMGHEPWTMAQTKERVHRSMRDSFPEIFKEEWQRAADLYQSNFQRVHLEMLTPLPLAAELLALLQNSDVYVAVVSNKRGDNLRKEVNHIDWGSYFEKVVGATDAEKDKPSPDPVHMALEGSGIKTGHHVWFVGDSITDMECAHNAGCYPVFFGDGDHQKEEFEKCPPSTHFGDHQDVIDFIRSW